MSVKKGQNVTITCESHGYPEPTYTIYHNGAVISNNKTYIIQSVNFNNAGSYRCEAKNRLGNDSSQVKNLTIIRVKPTVVINCSTPLVVDEGDNVSCVCRGEGGIPPANVTWFDKHNNIIGDVGVVSKTLVITNVTVNDGGNYTCKAQSYNDPRFRDEKSIEVTVKATYPPQQTNITISPMSVKKGQNVTITCESDGYPEPTYTIYHNGAVISNNKTYIIQSVNFNNAGSYRCEAKNKLGNDLSDVKNLTIIRVKPTVVINCSTPLVVNEGDNVSCVCKGEGGIPPANVTWFNKDNNIIGDVGVVSKTLVITNVTLNDGGNYTCKAQSYNDPRFKDEKSVEVTVKAAYPPQQTNITISPMSVKKGQNVTITCESDGYPEPTYTIYHNGAVISNNKTYIIQSVNFNNAGSYRCEAKNRLGNDSSQVKNLTIIRVKPTVVINCSTPLVVNEGDNVSCVCKGEGGIPPANVTWFNKDNNIIGDVGVVSKTLVITNVTVNDGGNYTCKAQSYNDPRFRDEKSIEVTVKATYPPQQTNITISPMSVKKGQNVTITCESDGYPEPTYTIYHNGAVISNNKTYIIQSVNFNNAGSYRCEAKNKLGNDLSDVKNLTIIRVKPTVVINCSTPLVVNEGDNVSCVCKGEGGIPPANVTWFNKDNNIIGDVGVVSKTLVITNVTLNDGGNYTCKAQSYNDPRFKDEKSVEVTVKAAYPPQQTNITISPMSVKKGQNVTITCESDGYPEPTYTIYHNGAVISNNKTYIIQSVNFNNAGSYRCEAKNRLGNDSSQVKNLTIIRVKPTVVINCSTPLVVDEGDNVSCVCRGEGGIPPANVTWFDKHNNIIGDIGVVNKTLVITNVTVNDGGNYTCKAQSYNDPRFRDEKSIEVTVKAAYPPQQTNITISPMSVKKGQNVTITCESDGYPEPTYTIYHNGAVISNNKTYIIQSVNFNNAGSYRCEAKNRLGNDSSQVKNLTIIKGKIVSPPPGTSFTFSPGETEIITWTFNDSINDLESRDWYFSGSSNGSQGIRLATVARDSSVDNFKDPILPIYDVYKPSTLQLRNITYSYDGTYEFRLARKDSPLSPFISKVRVFVARKIVSPPPGTSFTFLPGETEIITWTFNDSINDVESRDWYFTGSSSGSNAIRLATVARDSSVDNLKDPILPIYDVYKPSTLQLINITHSYDGTYEFRLARKDSPLSPFISKVRVFVARKIVSPPPGTSFTFLPGETEIITWTFNDSINDVESRDWYFTGSSGGSNAIRLATVARDSSVDNFKDPILPIYDVYKPSTLQLINITHSYDGTYEFRLARKDSPLSPFISKVRVFVAIKPNVTINCSNPLVVDEGDNVSCVCSGEGGNPPANVTWFDKDNNIIGNVGVVSKTLVITNVAVNDGGSYTCKAQSYNGTDYRDEKSIEIVVQYRPRQTNITISPMSAREGQNVTITCESDGYPEPTYTIYRYGNTSVVSDKKTHIIQSVNFSDAGLYRCEAKNKLGNDSSQVKNLTVNEAPMSSSHSLSPSIITSSMTFTVTFTSSINSTPTNNVGQNTPTSRDDGNNNSIGPTTLDKDDDDGPNIALIVGISVGSVFLVAILVVVIFCCYKSMQKSGYRGEKGVEPIDEDNHQYHYELDGAPGVSNESRYESVKDDKTDKNRPNDESKPSENKPPVYASINKENRQGNPLYSYLDFKDEPKRKPDKTRPAPTEYASIDMSKLAPVEKKDDKKSGDKKDDEKKE
ncbi:hemicentin-2-like [Xenia sp. Carnegie-2017]|uniref:hemicentin-2-like n=1 Tax=Xenia sp. Carnegie-2017 TaxID=2897299 RepID=UPI001F042DA1|nr:hemicentin-2-like [Xenia sp. Carnegie-2017]